VTGQCDGSLEAMDRLAQAVRPDGGPRGFQRWRHLLFLHWELPAATFNESLIPFTRRMATRSGSSAGVSPRTEI
jgi:uncharacterized protein